MNTTVPLVNDLRDVIRDAHKQIRQATKKEARMQRKYYDDRSRMTRFDEGQKVWLYWPRPPIRQQFKKLTRLWTGPWKIVLFKSPVVVELHHVSNGAIQVVHVDRLIPCVSLPAIGEETDDEPDTDNQPDTPDQAQVPNEVIQDIPGLFEENTLRQPQDSQTVDSQEPDSQFLPKFSGLQVVHSGSEAPGISGAIHPRLRPCDIKHKDSQVNTKILILE